VVLDAEHPDLVAARDDQWLDAWIFVTGKSAVHTVLSRGKTVVEHGRHISRGGIVERYKRTLRRLGDAA